jgi:dihydroxyacetone kinase
VPYICAGAVCGNIFASPSASQVRHAMDLVDNDKGYDLTSDSSPSLNVASQYTHHCQVGFSGPLQAIRADISEEITQETY